MKTIQIWFRRVDSDIGYVSTATWNIDTLLPSCGSG